MRRLRQMALWATTAGGALLLAVLTSRSEVGSQRIALALSSWSGRTLLAQSNQANGQTADRPFDAQAETRRLADTVRGLTVENDRLKSRLAAVEHNVDDITGSIAQQIEAAKAETTGPNPWPADPPPAPATPGAIASVVAPVGPPPAGLATPLPPLPAIPAAAESMPDIAVAPASGPTSYGVDIGSANSIQALRAHWLGIRSTHPQLFDGLTPTVSVREIPRANRVELRLVVGPFASANAAAQICASLAPLRQFCQVTKFDAKHVALR